ncbi:MAG: carboxypeptidase-like regulatory domain-containing protein, partial [Ferruginibacter sp.]|nr:carboxypeptidase-like regulatory domain-containing protein [Ferruginibacter sp.]
MRKLFSVFPLLLLAMSSFAQQKSITGTVSSKADNAPLAGVTVTSKAKVVQTDPTGKFSIEAATGDELTFTYVGFKAETIKVGNSQTLTIQLETL